MGTNPILSFLSETLNRLFAKSPAYFKVWNIILAIIVIIPQVPSWLEALNISVPTPLTPLVSKIISLAGLVGLFISKLTVKDPAATSLKFTESKAADKKVL